MNQRIIAPMCPVGGNPSIHGLLVSAYEQRTGGCLSLPVAPLLDLAWMFFCADQYAVARHRPSDAATIDAYAAFTRELLEQFLLFTDAGYRICLWPGLGEPYVNSVAMRADVLEHRRLWVYRTGEDFPSDHPLAAQTPIAGWRYNDVFRAVHDLIGHAWTGLSFSARGEAGACLAHALHHSVTALPALVCETRLQSAWIFFGPHRRDANGQPVTTAPLVFPPQKAFVPPDSCIHHHRWRDEQNLQRATLAMTVR